MKLNSKHKLKKRATNHGFTLIELLLVISIIGLLASVVLTATIKSRQNAEDNILIQNVTELSKAMDLFYQDNGYYPFTGMTDTTPCADFGLGSSNVYCILGARTGSPPFYSATNNNALATNLAPYLPQLPAQLTGDNKVPAVISITITNPNYNGSATIEDYQSNICYQLGPNSYFLWAMLNNRKTQANLNGYDTHGYILKSSNMHAVSC